MRVQTRNLVHADAAQFPVRHYLTAVADRPEAFGLKHPFCLPCDGWRKM